MSVSRSLVGLEIYREEYTQIWVFSALAGSSFLSPYVHTTRLQAEQNISFLVDALPESTGGFVEVHSLRDIYQWREASVFNQAIRVL